MKTFDERLEEAMPVGVKMPLKAIAEGMKIKPSTQLKQRLMLTQGIECERAIVPDSPIPDVWRWMYVRKY